MKIAQSMRLGAWLFIGLNLLMAFGSIWVFVRMAPAIEIIINRNDISLQACEKMLTSLVMANGGSEADITAHRESFVDALATAQQNITEEGEPAALQAINQSYTKAFAGDTLQLKKTVDAILGLSAINRVAMDAADKKAKQFGNAGAWGIVFMATIIFLVEMLFLRSLKRNLVSPLEEIHSVTKAIRNGEMMRRCTGKSLPKEINQIYSELNEILDKSGTQKFRG